MCLKNEQKKFILNLARCQEDAQNIFQFDCRTAAVMAAKLQNMICGRNLIRSRSIDELMFIENHQLIFIQIGIFCIFATSDEKIRDRFYAASGAIEIYIYKLCSPLYWCAQKKNCFC